MGGDETTDAIRTNSLKSIAILIAFPFVLPALLLAVVSLGVLFLGQRDWLGVGLRTFMISFVAMVIITLVWLPIGYFLNQWIVDQATGARLVARSELLNVWALLDSLSRRVGIRTPALRIIETEALNAYASGLTEGSYSVTVTSALVGALEDDELEAVLAHELTHIIHQDVRLMVVAGVLVGTVPLVHDLAMKAFWAIVMGILNVYRAVFTLLPLPGVKLMVEVSYAAMYWLGRIFAYAVGLAATSCSLVLQFALSRRREFMADAGAVQMTGNPGAMISALRKIAGNATLDTPLSAIRAMCIENSMPWFGLFATHPPIDDRIAALGALRANGHRAPPEPRLDADPIEELPDRRVGASTLDPAMVGRYRRLLDRAAPERLDVITREHLYRRARETVQNIPSQNGAVSVQEVTRARAHLEAAIDEIEADLARQGRLVPAVLGERR